MGLQDSDALVLTAASDAEPAVLVLGLKQEDEQVLGEKSISVRTFVESITPSAEKIECCVKDHNEISGLTTQADLANDDTAGITHVDPLGDNDDDDDDEDDFDDWDGSFEVLDFGFQDNCDSN